MTRDLNNNKHFIADEGKVFQRINNGFDTLSDPIICGTELILGKILVDHFGNTLDTPIDDKIEYYQEIDAPKEEEVVNNDEYDQD